MPVYALTIFLGAFLLFQVQPLIAKYILPWFGGGPGVWTICMLFFQLALLAGYAYAHALTHWLKLGKQLLLHVVLLLAAGIVLPIIPSGSWKPRGNENPTWHILTLLTTNIGLPYFVLASTGPLLQQWFARIYPATSPYRLYALSNVGSLMALLSYPFFFESRYSRKTQAIAWQWGFVLYALCCALCVFRRWKAEKGAQSIRDQLPPAEFQPTSQNLGQSSRFTWLLWLLWPACGSLLLLAITNKICQDVAVVPFLWILPLALYLLSFIICFEGNRWYVPAPFTVLLIAAICAITWVFPKGAEFSLRIQMAIYLVGLFVCCMVCHGELFRLKPKPSHLTLYYLMIACGGALGGLFVALAAPVLFTSYFEVQYALLFCALLMTWTRSSVLSDLNLSQWRWLACVLTLCAVLGLDFLLTRLNNYSAKGVNQLVWQLRIGLWALMLLLIGFWIARRKFKSFVHWKLMSRVWLWLGCMMLSLVLWVQARSANPDIVYTARNFYGVLRIFEHDRDKPLNHHFLLQHGRITHGIQFVDPQLSSWPTAYYSEQSGIALAVANMRPAPRRIGVIGLGAGTMAAFARPGDYVRFYEINPEVTHVAHTQFTYLKNCPAQVELALGDARLSLEREPPQNFDLLALDAFSSDAIPVHLLTREAFALYARHLQTNGIIAIHISNHYLNLEPVLLQMARQFGYEVALIDYDEFQEEWWEYSSSWMLLSHNKEFFKIPSIHSAASSLQKAKNVKLPLWTDDFTSLFQILK